MERSSKSSSRPPRPRGRSCMLCRYRKVACDGARPVCGQCRSRGRGAEEDCQYADSGDPSSHMPMLEWNIARLQRRIKELTENRPMSTHVISTSSATSPNLSQEFCEKLLTSFFRHKHFPFFLDETRFREGVFSNNEVRGPTASLLTAVYLWGFILDSPQRNFDVEQMYLGKVLRHLPMDLAGSHRNRILHSIQAEILLSVYYLDAGNRLESGYHANAATSLAISANLHCIGRFVDRSQWSVPATVLPPSESVPEELERIRAFWACFVVTHELTLDSVPSFLTPPYMEIVTPWPEEPINYGASSSRSYRAGTLKMFLDNAELGEGQEPVALHVKASILFSRAVSILKMDPDLTPASTTFVALDSLIDSFKSNFPRSDTAIATSYDLLLAFSLMQVASIRINAPFSDASKECGYKCFMSAFQTAPVIELCRSSSLHFIHPMLGLLWVIVADVLMAHVSISRASGSIISGRAAEESIKDLETMLGCLQQFSERSLLLSHYVQHIREEFLKIS